MAVVSVRTRGLVTTPPKSFRMNDSMSSSRPVYALREIQW
jgi:hypothetical protein